MSQRMWNSSEKHDLHLFLLSLNVKKAWSMLVMTIKGSKKEEFNQQGKTSFEFHDLLSLKKKAKKDQNSISRRINLG